MVVIDTNSKKFKSFSKHSDNYLKEYLNNTSIHGFRYLAQRRTCVEKIWWFLVLASCLGSCAYLINSLYKKWDENPIAVTYNSVHYKVYDIPFPSVTICPELKFNHKFYHRINRPKFWEHARNGTLKTRGKNYISYISSVCPAVSKKIKRRFQFKQLYNNFYKTMEEVSPPFHIKDCYFLQKKRECNKIFTKIITDVGICQTFNILDRNDFFRDNVFHYKDYHKVNHSARNWTMDFGYVKDAPPETFPERALSAGAQYSLEFQLGMPRNEVYQDLLCGGKVSGFIALLHVPLRVPRLTSHFIRIPLDSNVVATIQPYRMMTSRSYSMKFYSPEKRNCYFQSERQLYYFKNYSQNNCEIECLTNRTWEKCQCVQYYLPRERGRPICNGNNRKCMNDATKQLLLEEIRDDRIFRSCNCLPLCMDVTYHATISQASWAPVPISTYKIYNNEDYDYDPDDESYFFDGPLNNTDGDIFSQFTVYFMNKDFFASKKVENINPYDFLANFGGLISLFTGFSILSLMEIIYFATIRWCCNFRMFGRCTEENST